MIVVYVLSYYLIFALWMTRQLNLYDFVRMKKAKQSDTYYHLSFVRGCPDMLSVSSKVFDN